MTVIISPEIKENIYIKDMSLVDAQIAEQKGIGYQRHIPTSGIKGLDYGDRLASDKAESVTKIKDNIWVDPNDTISNQIYSPSVYEFANEYPELSRAFRNIQAQQYETFAKKMLSYGLHNISVGSNLETEEEKQLSLTGIWFRMNDKIQRLKQLVMLQKNNPLEDEPVEDAYQDLSVYGIISLLVKSDKWKK